MADSSEKLRKMRRAGKIEGVEAGEDEKDRALKRRMNEDKSEVRSQRF